MAQTLHHGEGLRGGQVKVSTSAYKKVDPIVPARCDHQFLEEYETVGRLSHRLATKPPYIVKQLKQKGLKPLVIERNMSVIYRKRDLPEKFLQVP